MRFPRFAIWALGVAALATGGYFLFLHPASATRIAESGRPAGRPAPVVVAAVAPRAVPITLGVIGNVEAYSTVSIKSRIDGQLVSAGFQEGQLVHKGDLLFSIDPRSFEAQVQQAEATLARDQAQLEGAKADLARYTRLSKSGYSSEQQFEQQRATTKALEATIRADQAALEIAKLQLEYTQIKSPIDGRTGNILIKPGNLVKANDTNAIVVINQTEPIYVSFAVPEQNLTEIKRRMAQGPLKVEAHVPGADKADTGEVTFVNNAVDASTGTIQIKATFANADERLTPGQFVEVTVFLSVLENALVVPSEAIQAGQNGPYVFVVKPDQTAESRPVVTGPSVDGFTVVAQGLKAGERVITEGQLRVVPGAKVDPKPKSPA
ncbi:MAG TPA: efflux RND transporter periplasmic adaptor subunit [Alphaproteobacteria bacterium]|jgi:multidrug efflux system membrane fusion protein|nr:efflux RND transporter periplasmic adaptor subunit [Alphaproteobacteria bacterium]